MEGKVWNRAAYVLFYAAIVLTVLGGCGNSKKDPPVPITYSISGKVSGAVVSGVTVNLTGASTANTTTDSSGNYSFTGLANGSYTVIPSKSNYLFNPLNTAVTVNGANITGKNFTAALNYTNASLNGEYYALLPMISKNSNTLLYDESTGTGNFNGNGTATLSGTTRRVDVGAITSSLTTTNEINQSPYSVSSNGSFTLGTPDDQTLIGQIALCGNAVLIDGTGRTDLSELTGNYVGMKKVTLGSAPTYTNASLNGEYLFQVTEVHRSGSTVEYCDQAGTLSFNGSGSVTTNITTRCSEGSIVTTSSPTTGTGSYTVNADGSFVITDPLEPEGEGFHGQIVLDGTGLMLDASLRPSANTLFDHGIAMKRVTAGSAPTYTSASLSGEYLFMETEVRDLEYCLKAGTASFNGSGTVIMNGTERCSDGTTITQTDISNVAMTYSVNSDGSFTRIHESSDGLHGQIVLDGNTLLLDGTTIGTNPNDYLYHGVAMKR